MMDAGAATNRLRRLHAHLGPAEHGRLGPSCPSTADQRRAIAPTPAAAGNSYWHGHSVNCALRSIISPGSSPAPFIDPDRALSLGQGAA